MATFEIDSYYNTLTGERLENLTGSSLDLKHERKMISVSLPSTPRKVEFISLRHMANVSFDKTGFVCMWMMGNEGQNPHVILLRTRPIADAKSVVFTIRDKAHLQWQGSTYGLNSSKNFYIASLQQNIQLANRSVPPTAKQRNEQEGKHDHKKEEITTATGSVSSKDCASGKLSDVKSSDEDIVRSVKRRRTDSTEPPVSFDDLIHHLNRCMDGLDQLSRRAQVQAAELEKVKSDNARLEKELATEKEKGFPDSEGSFKLLAPRLEALQSKIRKQSQDLETQEAKNLRQLVEYSKLQTQKDGLQHALDEIKTKQTKTETELLTYKANEIKLTNDVDNLKDLIGMCISVVDPDKFLLEMKNGSTVSEAHMASIRKR